MSKRNFILLTIILIIIVIAVLGFLYSQRNVTTPGEDSSGTNFISQFNPFGSDKPTTTPPGTTPTNVSGYEPGPEQEEIKLIKVSSMPVAGFTVYLKERLKEINPIPTLPLSGGFRGSKINQAHPTSNRIRVCSKVCRQSHRKYLPNFRG